MASTMMELDSHLNSKRQLICSELCHRVDLRKLEARLRLLVAD